MDKQSAEMYSYPIVRVQDYKAHESRIQAKCERIFGRQFDISDFVNFMGAPDGSELIIDPVPYGDDDLALHLGYSWFNGTHDYCIYLDNERRVVRIENTSTKPNAPDGLETRLFAKQVQSFREYGVDEIQLFADGYAGHPGGIIGYYVWARFGFSMNFGGLATKLIEDGLVPCDNTLDLMIQPGGDQWWYNNGSAREAFFYLSEGSPCLAALETYLREKGVDLDGE